MSEIVVKTEIFGKNEIFTKRNLRHSSGKKLIEFDFEVFVNVDLIFHFEILNP